MRKETVINNRYPHHVTIIRTEVSENPFEENDKECVMYDGPCRSYSDSSSTGDGKVDKNKRKLVVPVRYDMWSKPILDGDAVSVTIGCCVETGVVRDFEPDNGRSMVTWEFNRV